MKNRTVYISLSMILPFIATCFVLLSVFISYDITSFFIRSGFDPIWYVVAWGTILALISGLSTVVITRALIRPVSRLVDQAERLGVVEREPQAPEVQGTDEISHFTNAVHRVAEVLSRVQTTELFPEVTAQSEGMRGVLSLVKRIAPTDATVLILGQSGTGKELIARSLHQNSQRADRPFVPINCAAIPQALLESELFGHERGAFTGATSRKLGKFEVADGGTVLLDEIGDMSLETQAKLLRVIEMRVLERVGGTKPIPIDVRLMAATNQDLADKVQKGTFREDLFYRINVFTMSLPRLRDRKSDIAPLASRFAVRGGVPVRIAPEAMHLLQTHEWPGNVRELRNAIGSALALADDVILPVHLPASITRQLGRMPEEGLALPEGTGLDQHLVALEKATIIDALRKSDGVQAQAARLLGIKERSLWHRVAKYGIDVAAFKPRT